MGKKKKTPKYFLFGGMRAGKTAMADMMLKEADKQDLKKIALLYGFKEEMIKND